MTRFAPIALVVLWSSGFVGATLAAQSAPAETTLLWRYVLATGPLLGWAAWTRRRYGARFLAREGAIGILAHGGYLLGVYRAADMGVLPGTSALVASLQPPLVALLLWSGSAGRTDRREALGLLTGLVGVLLVVGSDLGGAGGAAGLVSVGLGMLSLTAATLVASRWPAPEEHGVADSLVIQAVVSLGFFTAVTLATGTATPPRDTDFWLAIAWLVVLPFLGGYGTYLYVLRTSGPVVVSAWLYLTPAIAAAWAWPMFGEPLTVRAAMGFLIAAAGVAAVVRPTQPIERERRGPDLAGPASDSCQDESDADSLPAVGSAHDLHGRDRGAGAHAGADVPPGVVAHRVREGHAQCPRVLADALERDAAARRGRGVFDA